MTGPFQAHKSTNNWDVYKEECSEEFFSDGRKLTYTYTVKYFSLHSLKKE